MTEPLKIFGKEFARTNCGLVCRVGLCEFWISTIGGTRAAVNGHELRNNELGIPIVFINERMAVDALEYEGRRIAREMIAMAGEMVAGHTGAWTRRNITEMIPVRFKDK